ncbi:MAG: PEGA domain-containing protein [Patescibacteria group bacterium]
MTKKTVVILAFILLFVLLVFILFFRSWGSKKAAVQLNAFPQSAVYIDGREAGTTPYENNDIKSGEVVLRLVPEAAFSASWERKVTLNPSTQTVVNWEFNADSAYEAGELIYFEKTSLKERSGLIVNCLPDACSISVDGQMRGFSPLNLEDVGDGSHKILISLPGYKSREILARAVKGYRLVIETKLAKETVSQTDTPEPTEVADEPGDELATPYVIIGETPTGWLRVRIEPSVAASEAAKVNPGDKFSLLDEEAGWYQIEYQVGKKGWVSGDYADKLD